MGGIGHGVMLCGMTCCALFQQGRQGRLCEHLAGNPTEMFLCNGVTSHSVRLNGINQTNGNFYAEGGSAESLVGLWPLLSEDETVPYTNCMELLDDFVVTPFDTPQPPEKENYTPATQYEESLYMEARIVLQNYKTYRERFADKRWVRKHCAECLELIMLFEKRFQPDVIEEAAAGNKNFMNKSEWYQHERYYYRYQGMVIDELEFRRRGGVIANVDLAKYLQLCQDIISYERYENSFNRELFRQDCAAYVRTCQVQPLQHQDHASREASFMSKRARSNEILKCKENDTAQKDIRYKVFKLKHDSDAGTKTNV